MSVPATSDAPVMRNIGPLTAARLAGIGVRDLAQLRRTGAVPAFVALRRSHGGVSLNALYALAGALQDRDWRDVRRMQKLELLVAVEDYEREQARAGAADKARGRRDELLGLRNIGKAMRRDFELLGVHSVSRLARCSPDRLYRRLERITGKRQDPCVLDTFAAAVHEARTGEALPWWHFSRLRKRVGAGARKAAAASGAARRERGHVGARGATPRRRSRS